LRRYTVSAALLLLSLAVSLAAVSEIARPANAVTSNSNPPTIAKTGDNSVYQSSYQSPGFYAQGRYWVFYEDSSSTCEHQAGCLFYVWSADGATLWSTPVNVGIHVTDNDWSVVTDGTSAYYARYNETSFGSTTNRALLFGMGQLGSSGLITWLPEQVVLSPNAAMKFQNDVIGVDSNGQVWVGYQQDNSGTKTPHIIHSNSTLPLQPLSTSFVVNASDPTIFQTVNFTATAVGGNWGGSSGYAFSWNFGDGSTANGQSVTHQYTTAGNYTATLNSVDNGNPRQTASSAQTVPVELLLPSTNTSPILSVPASRSVKTGTPVSFTVTSSDNDGDTVTLSSGSLPLGASFNPSTGQFTWSPTPDQANQFWSISFNATDNVGLAVMKQVLVYVSPLWSGDFPLSTSVFNNWHVNIATLPGGGQVYAAYWADGQNVAGRLYNNRWGPEELISGVNQQGQPLQTSVDVNSFLFASGGSGGVSAIYYNNVNESLYFSSRGPQGGWGPDIITHVGVASAGSLGRYSLPFTAAFDQGDSRWYVFWYYQSTNTITEWSGAYTSWLQTNSTFPAQASVAGSTIGSFHYSSSVNGKNAFGVMWIDGTTSPYNLNFGLETVGQAPGSCGPNATCDSSWNPRVTCTAQIVTIEQILGSQSSTFGGATQSGSIFNPGIRAPGKGEAKRWLTPGPTPPQWTPNGPPCTITNADGQTVGAFVELLGVQRGFLLNEDYSANFDPVNGGGAFPSPGSFGDTTFNIFTPGYGICKSTNTTGCLHTIHAEIDRDWKATGYCGPNTVCDVYPMAVGPVSSAVNKTRIDVQGFIYWDPDHADEAAHSFSGWEIHPLTAWRISCPQAGYPCSPGFSLNATPHSVTISPGKSATANITINSSNLFSGRVNFTATISPSGPSAPTLVFNPSNYNVTACNLCGVIASKLNITTTTASSGTYNITVTARSATVTGKASVLAVMVGFNVTSSPSTLNIPAGTSAQSAVTLTSLGYAGTVSLTAQVSGCGCLLASISPLQVTLSVGGKASATLNVTAFSPGNALVTITGTSSTSPSFTVTTTVSVNAVDFTISAGQTSLRMYPGSPNSTVITLTSLNGFSGSVTIKATSTPAGLTQPLNATSVILQPGGTAHVSLVINGTQPGIYIVTVNATSGSVSHLLTITVNVVDFSLSSASSLQVNLRSTGTSTINLTSLGGFAGTVSLSNSTSSSALHDALSQQVVSLSSGGSGSAMLTVYGTSSGNYTVTITATSGPLRHTIIISVNVVDFQISAGTVTPASINVGFRGNATITVTRVNGFTGTVALSISAPSALTCTLSSIRLTLPPSPATSILSCSSSTANDYTVTVTGINGTLSHTTANILFHVVDFTVTLLPSSSLSLVVGQNSGTTSIHLGSVNGFAGSVALNVLVSSSGPSATPSLSNLVLTSAGCACNSTVLNINAGQIAGVYTLNVTATNGLLTHWAIITLTVTKANPTVTTVIKDSTGAAVTSVTVGTTVHDTATINGGSQPGGIVAYIFFTNGLCTSPGTSAGTVTVTNGSVPDSSAFTPITPGSYSFNANYSGDPGNNKASSSCEPLNVTAKLTPTLNTAIKDTNGAIINTVSVGTTVRDTATLSGGSTVITGTVTYFFFTNIQCSGPPSTAFPPFPQTVTVGSGHSIPPSASLVPGAGLYSFNATYSGDATNNPVTSPCEPLTINKQTPVITTSISPSSSITVGSSVTDQATLTGGFPSTGVTGTVTYGFFGSGSCSGTTISSSTVTVGAANSVPGSISVPPPSAGAFAFNATYSGDANNTRVSGPCEPLTVIKQTPSISTTINPSSTITVGASVSDQATLAGGFPSTGVTGSVVYAFFTNSVCGGSPVSTSTVTVGAGSSIPVSNSVTPASAGTFAFNATYSGDGNNNRVSSSCEGLTVNKQTPAISTAISPGSSITVGTAVTDHATLTGGFPSTGVTGTVSYFFFTGSTCTGTAVSEGTVTIGTGNSVPASNSVTTSLAGSYSFNATYSGDANNNRGSSACEPLTASKATPTISTSISPSVTITVGASVTDQATLTSGFPSTGVSGSVTYALFSNGACAGTPTSTSSATVGAGNSVPASASVTPPSAGSYAFNATYSGDGNNNRVSSSCELLTVNKAGPFLGTIIKDQAGATVTSVIIGASVHDTSTITGGFQPTGTVTYDFFTNGACTAPGSSVGIVTVTGGIVPDSSTVTPANAASYSFNATYSGDGNNNPSASTCEPLTVLQSGTTITTAIKNSAGTVVSSVVVGSPVHDTAVITGSTSTASGTATYNFFNNGVCGGTAASSQTVTVANALVPDSSNATPTPAGIYSYNVTYSGDSNNQGAKSSCEPLTVNKTIPTIATSLSSASVTAGASITDSSILANSFQASGSVTYNQFTGGVCSGTATAFSTVTVTNGIVPNSGAATPIPAGSYSFNAVYGGDVNNNGATSPCELLAVNKASPNITTALSATTITVGTSVTDSSTMASFFQAGGTVTYNEFSGATCTGTATAVSTVTVTNGIVPNSASITPVPAGSFSFSAVYSGDPNNNGAASPCELLTVNKTSPTITTSISSAITTVGSSVSDSSTLSSFFQAAGSVTYHEFIGATCAGSSTVVSVVTVTNGVIPNSASVTPTPAGSYSFDAAYSGDANNNVATSACEPLTVNKTNPTVTTTLSTNPIQAGQSATDSATLTGSFQAGGTLTYRVFANGACTTPGTIASIVSITNGVAPNSRAVTFNSTGPYSFQAVYSGDSNNNGATSVCEPLTVNPVTGVTISTALSTNVPTVGNSVTDAATLSGAISASGTVTYTLYANSPCTPSGTVVSIVTVSNGVVPNSRAVIFNATGPYSFQANYSGDSNNNPATSACELLTVQKASPSIGTSLSASTVVVGNSVTDSSRVTNGYNAGGSVTYESFTGSTCSGTPTIVGSTVAVTNGSVPDSSPQIFNLAGAYSWNAIYSGDSNNNGATSSCESLTVSKANPTISTTLSSASPTVGTGVVDSSTLANGFSAGGSVTYSLFANVGCNNPGTVVSTVIVTSGTVPDSRTVTFNATGTYGFLAAYSGDANNNPSPSVCEPVFVQKASPTIITTLSSSTPVVGTGVTDSASLTGGFQATGMVVYSVYSNSACSGTGATVSTVTVTNGIVPDSRSVLFNATGQYTFRAFYSGDSNNNGVSNDCEALTVQKANPTISTQLTSATPTVGTSVHDSATLSGGYNAGGTLTYSVFANGFCVPSATVASTVAVTSNTVPNSRAVLFNATGSFSFQAAYSGDGNNNGASSSCEALTVQKASPTIATQLLSTGIPVGGLASDSAIITGGYVAGGTVSYEFFAGSSCSGTATGVGTPVTVSNGIVPNSASQSFNSAGPFSWNALYSGDSNNNAATSLCEPLTVNMANPTLATTLSSTTPIVGKNVSDSSALSGSFSATGTVTYSIFTNNACTSPGSIISVVTVTAGTVPNSRAVQFNSTGAPGFQATYSGDANNNAASSSCEPLSIQKASPSITTALSSTSILVGQSATDSASLANSFQASGSVTYSLFANGGCVPSGTPVSTVTVTNGEVPSSRSVLFNNTGSYSFEAAYSGDPNNNSVVSGCEPLNVNPAGVTINTNLSTGTITVGGSITDSSTLQGETATAGGTVTYGYFANSNCAGTGIAFSVATVTNGLVPNSRSIIFNNTGTYSLQAVYGGDANNNGASSSCEPLTVQRASPTIGTMLSAPTTIVGSSISDSSTLTGSFNPGGTVTYSDFTNNACTAPGTVVSIVTVSGGVVPDSRAVTFNGTGSFSFQAVYSGDANNNGAMSSCTPLTVNKASPTIGTTLSATTITVGGSVSDSSTLAIFYKAIGTVIYGFFSGSTCTGPVTTVGTPVTVTNGAVPNSVAQTFSSAGSFSWNAVYSGDANNNGATSPCEPLIVNKTTPTLSTSLSSTSITVGTSATDSAVLIVSFQAGGTVTYSFFTNIACTAPGTVASTVTVTGGVIPNSRAVTFNSTASDSFEAVYSGDANNNGATSGCEPLTVNKTNPSIATTLSSTSIQVSQSVTDSSTLTSIFSAGGSVTYNVFVGSSTCTIIGSGVSTVTVTNGIVPNSRSVTFNATNPGGYSWNAVYSGDVNNNGAASGCEPLTVSVAGVNITTSLSATTITVGGSVSDSSTLHSQTSTASGTVTYSDFANGNCASPATVVASVTVTNGVVPSSGLVTFNSAGSFSFEAVYSGDLNNNGAASPCEPLVVAKASPGVSTSLSAPTITVGGTASDSSTLSGAFNAGGTVTYEYFTIAGCTGSSTTVGNPVTVTGGLVPNSSFQSFNAAGSYSWNAVYSGDSNNNGAASPCEPLTVNKASPTLATALSSSSIVVGMTGVDSATLNSGFETTGTVTYLVFTNGVCSAPGAFVSLVTVSGNVVSNSRAVTFNSTGPYSFDASYSGDTNNNVAASPCEPLTVVKASPTVTTTISPASTVIVGNTVTDQATLNGGTALITGTVTYEFFGLGDGNCSGSSAIRLSVNVGNPIPASNPQTITVAGQYSFDATYSGDATNNAATSTCEPLTVLKASPTITTSLSSTTINVGATATDSSILTNGFNSGGTVTYAVFANGACTSPFSTVSTVQVTNGVSPDSRPVTFNATGSYSFQAVYSGDANNIGVTSACEPVAVQRISPTLSTSLSTLNIAVGNSVTDSSDLTGGFQPSGSVTYTVYGNQACNAPGSIAAIVTVVGGIVPDSRPVVFNATGIYSLRAAYGGDTNNNAATSTCEPLTVAKVTPVITTSLSSTGITIGQSVTDSATLTNSFRPTGSVSYYFFSTSSNCATTATILKTVTIGTDYSVPNSGSFTPPGTGSVSFDAVYSGDANNNLSTSSCEPLTVNKASPTITANLSAVTISVGQSLTNSASLSGGFPSTGVQGIVAYNYFTSTVSCSGSPNILTTVSVGGGDSVPGSGPFTPPNAGSFSFNTVYQGDANNNPATSSCEPLTVGKASPTIATTILPPSIVVGNTATDSSTVSGGFNAGGILNYILFGDSVCTTSGSVVSSVTVTGGIIPNSRAVPFNETGNYAFQASYSGDSNNNPVVGSCESLTVAKASPGISTQLAATTITVGGTASDSATLRGGYQIGGTVTYQYFVGASCSGTGTSVGPPVTVTNGAVPDSVGQSFSSASSYSWNAVYSGDSNNNGTTSPCEPLTVNKTSPTILTSLSLTSIQVDQSVTDSASLTSAYRAGGTVSYTVFANGVCTAPGNVVSVVSVTNNQIQDSRSVLFNATGTFSFSASYSGDANNNGALSSCEPLPVNPVGVSITTTLSATTIGVGGSASDSATLSGETASASGNVVYNYFANGNCAAPAIVVSTVTVSNGVVPNSALQNFNSAGTYSWNALYGGDSNNNRATSGCEPLLVSKVTPTLTSSTSTLSTVVGTSVTDSSSLTSGFGATGTVFYTMFTNGACLSSGTQIDSVILNAGVVPDSRAVTFNVTGSYSFQARYSGDANNNGATSACEPLTITKANPSISTSLSASTIVVSGSVHDSATIAGGFHPSGSATYEYFIGSGTCAGTPTVVGPPASITNSVVPDSLTQTFNSAGQYSWNALYTGDINNVGAASQCEPLTVNKTNPAITTTLSSTTIIVGGSAIDSAALSGSYNAGGIITYGFFSGSSCTGTATTVGSPVSVTSGVVPNSASQSFSSAGSFSWNAIYSGDSNNNGATSVCELLAVGTASPSIATSLSSTSIVVGTSVTDSASLTNSFDASGTVTYTLFATSVCGGQATSLSRVAVTAGRVPNSRVVTLNSTGTFGFTAVYSGDSNNDGATSNCEVLTVQKASPTVSTTLSATAVTVGSSVSDSAALTGAFQATGTVTYSLFTNGACVSPGTIVATVAVINGLAAKSRTVIFNATGSYGFEAAYSGDANNKAANGNCNSLQVNPKGVLISTSLSQIVVTVGGSVADSATMSGQTSNAGGTVTYNIFANTGCASPGTIISTVTISNGIVPDSRRVVINLTLSYSFNAAYSGDSNNNATTSGCEPLTVLKTSPSIATSLSSTTSRVGTVVTDSAVLTNGFNASGTVTYGLFNNSGCASPGTTVSIVAVLNGIISNSRAVIFNATGSYGFQAVYSGDTNNNGAIGPCELLIVNKASPTVATTLSTTTITVGGSVVDSSVLMNFYKATGTVTYEFFKGSMCSGAATTVGTPVPVTNGAVPKSATQSLNSAGLFSWTAVYSGDVNNSGATSTCEPLTVNRANPTLNATLSVASITAGDSATASATLTSGFQAGGTATYEFFTTSTCTGTPTIVGIPVPVSNGTIPRSSSHAFATPGSYYWYIIYGGDTNNTEANSQCILLTVLSPPVLSVPGTLTVTAGSTIRFFVNATDGSKTVTLTASNLPPGATFSSTQSFTGGTTSVFTWTPSNGQPPGDYNVTFTAQDTQGASTASQVTIHVSAVSKTPPLPLVSYSIFGVVGFLVIIGAALLLRRVQNPGRRIKAWLAQT